MPIDDDLRKELAEQRDKHPGANVYTTNDWAALITKHAGLAVVATDGGAKSIANVRKAFLRVQAIARMATEQIDAYVERERSDGDIPF